MNKQDTEERRPRGRRMAIVAGCAVAVAAAVFAIMRKPAEKAGSEAQATFTVLRGPMTIGVVQSGRLQATEQQIIMSEVQGQTTILFLIEEGTRVKTGDLLVELDASNLQDGLVEQQIRTQNAEAAFIRARENLAVVKNQTESDISLAELNSRFAKEDLTQYTEGRYKQELMAADSKITLAEEELQLGTRKLEWSEKLFSENYISQSECDADRLSFNRAKLDLELAKAQKVLLEDYTYTRQVAQLESDVAQTDRALERVKLKASADIVQAEADFKAKEAEWGQQKSKEDKLVKQIEKTKIFAPRDGLVVYASSVKTSWRGGDAPLEAGQTVRERQELIYLPTADQMMAVVQVHESHLDKIRLGLPVIITVDALEGRSFVGHITRIAPLPDATSMWMNPDLKVYRTEIEIEGRQPELRTGMSCMAEIVVDRYEDAVYVPVQAVLRVGGRPTVYVARGDGFEPVPVEVGLDNNRMVHIRSGLEAGQVVLLTPPLQEAATMERGTAADGQISGARLDSLLRDANAKTNAAPPAAAAAAEASAPAPDGAATGDAAARPPLTDERRAEMRKRLEAMTPEQRAEAMKRRGSGHGAGGGRPGGGG